jgi:hypothetical protein
MSGSQKRRSPANTGHDCPLPNEYTLPTNFAGSDNPEQITRRSRDSPNAKTRRLTCEFVAETRYVARRRAVCNRDHTSCRRQKPRCERVTGLDKILAFPPLATTVSINLHR